MTDREMVMALPAELIEWKATLRRFVDEELIPHERTGSARLSPEVLERIGPKVKELGLWAADVPTAFGGSGLGALEYAVATEELGRSLYWLDIMELGTVMAALFRGTPEQIERYVGPSVRGERRVRSASRNRLVALTRRERCRRPPCATVTTG